MQDDMPQHFYITFWAPITQHTVNKLWQTVENYIQLRPGWVKKLTLIISSPGGQMTAALSACRYLKQTGLNIDTHGFGSVTSAGLLLYCLGNARYAAPGTLFTMHPITFPPANISYDVPLLTELAASCKEQEEQSAGIIAVTTGKHKEAILVAMRQRSVFNTDAAKDYGIVTEITDKPFVPEGCISFCVGELDSSIPAFNPFYSPLPPAYQTFGSQNIDFPQAWG